MEIKAVQKATILSQALPYIQKYNDSQIILTVGQGLSLSNMAEMR